MYDTVLIVAPVFGLIAFGFVLARFGIVSKPAGAGLSEFVFTVAVPALLFRMMVTAKPVEDASPLALWGAFYGAVAITWGLAALATWGLLRRPARDGAAISMGSCFGNIVMLGIPLSLDRFGAEAGTPLALILSISSPLMWFAGTLHIELVSRRGDLAVGDLLKDLALSLLKNPIIIGLLAGVAWRTTGLGLHPVPDKMIALLGQAAVPAALVALGLGLTAFELKGQVPTIILICALSLIAYPALAWALAFHLFDLPPLWAGVAVLLAACPPGANAYLFATRYDAAPGSVSAAVAFGTALSIISVTLILIFLQGQM